MGRTDMKMALHVCTVLILSSHECYWISAKFEWSEDYCRKEDKTYLLSWITGTTAFNLIPIMRVIIIFLVTTNDWFDESVLYQSINQAIWMINETKESGQSFP